MAGIAKYFRRAFELKADSEFHDKARRALAPRPARAVAPRPARAVADFTAHRVRHSHAGTSPPALLHKSNKSVVR